MTFVQILALVAVGLVTLVLLAGLVNLMRRGPPNRSQKLMRARVLFQFIAVILMMTALYIATN